MHSLKSADLVYRLFFCIIQDNVIYHLLWSSFFNFSSSSCFNFFINTSPASQSFEMNILHLMAKIYSKSSELYAQLKTEHLLTSASRLVCKLGCLPIEVLNSMSVTSRCSVGTKFWDWKTRSLISSMFLAECTSLSSEYPHSHEYVRSLRLTLCFWPHFGHHLVVGIHLSRMTV